MVEVVIRNIRFVWIVAHSVTWEGGGGLEGRAKESEERSGESRRVRILR